MGVSKDISIKPLHVGISVPKMDESISWYTDMLGFAVESDEYVEPLKARIVFMRHGDFSIELFEIKGSNPLPDDRRVPNLDIRTHGTKHVAYVVEDLKMFIDSLKNKKVDIAMDVFPMGKDLVCFIRDNSGNLLEFIQQNAVA